MNFDFAECLTMAVLITGLFTLMDVFYLKKRTIHSRIVSQARSFFPLLLIVWIIRSFVIQPYRVPTGSLEPTVMPGDFIAVQQYAYGLRFPIGGQKILTVNTPQRGEIALFRWPQNPKILFVKRVIGVPGDRLVYKNKMLTVNGEPASQILLYQTYDQGSTDYQRLVDVKEEQLGTLRHKIYVEPAEEADDFEVVVPEGHYFMMGDNRDDSNDSRHWGFVPDANLIGKAFGVWMSWDAQHHAVRWNRIGIVLR